MRVVIFGAGGQGRVTLDLVRNLPRFQPAGFIDDDPAKKGRSIDGVKVLGGSGLLPGMKKKIGGVVLAVADGSRRREIFERCQTAGLRICGFIHKTATISRRAEVDPTAMIWPHAVVNVGAILGRSALINTNATVEHDVDIGAFCHVAPGAVICGNCHLGEESWIGAGATVIQGLTIGRRALIGAGSVVVREIPSGVTALGNPCRIQEKRRDVRN